MIDLRNDKASTIEEEVAQRLVARGLIDEIPQPLSDEEDSDFELIEVRGETVSDMIIRERR